MPMHLARSQFPRAVAMEPAHDDMYFGRVVTMPAHDVIARRAYYIYVQSGCKQGQCTHNWHQAETELQSVDRQP
jgi:hypothetical protein